MTDETLFAAALEQPDPAAYLDAHCPDPEARRRVDELLAAHAAAGSFLNHPAVGTDVTSDLAPSDPGVTRTQAPTDPDATADPRAAHANPDEALAFLKPPTRPGSLGRLAHYEVLEVLGSGGFGTVLKAFDDRLHRVVAVKVLAPQLAASGAARARFLREARTAAAVRDEHVVNVFAVSDDDAPVPFLVMELVAGQTLQGKIDKAGPLPPKEVLRIGSQIARGLAAAHKQGLIHRDIKPANILLENGVERVKVTDFGLARAADDASISQSGVVAGTPMYMSPEQARGDALDTRSDLFSLGSVLYVLCTGRPPFRAETTLAVLKRVVEDDPRPVRDVNPEVPRWLADVVAKLHAKNPADRFQTAAEVADLLSGYLAELQQQGTVVSRVAAPPAARRKPGGPVVLLLVLLAAAVAVAGVAAVVVGGLWWGNGLFRSDAEVVVAPSFGLEAVRLHRDGTAVGDWTDVSTGQTLRLPPGRYRLEPRFRPGVTAAAWDVTTYLSGGDTSPATSTSVSVPPVEFDLPPGGRVTLRVEALRPLPAVAPFSPEQAKAQQEAWAKHLGLPVEFAHPSGLAFRLVPPGEFGMGFDSAEQEAVRKTLQGLPNVGAYQRFAAESSGPRHTVRITRPFYLAKYETTAGQFRRFVEAAKHAPTGTIDWQSFVTPGQEEKQPVIGVSWDDGVAFCRRLGPGYELPSEAQWEYAARGGAPGLWSFGNDPTKLLDHAVFGQAWPKPAPVGQKAANPFGLFDVHGNADEWCRDWHVADYYRRSPIDDPVNLDAPADPATGRASRGGSWNAAAVYTEVAFRSFDHPTRPVMPKGFRVALTGDLKAAVDAARGSGKAPVLQPLKAIPSPAGSTIAVQFFPDGQRLLVGGARAVAAIELDGRAAYNLAGTAAGPGAVLSPDGKTLYRAAAADPEKGPFHTTVHDAATGAKLREYPGLGNALAVSPDGRLLAGDGPNYALVVVEAATGKAVHTLTGHTGALRARAFSPDGKRLVSTAEDDTVRVWDVEAGKELFSKPGHGRGEPGGLVGSVAWLPDGSAFLSSGQDGEVRVYDPAGGPVRAWATGQRFVRVLRPDRDGRRLLTVGQESREVKLWALGPPATLLAVYRSPADRPFDAAFAPDGATVATAGGDGVVRLWPAPPAASADPPVDGFTPLFNGRDLAGWVARAEPGQPPERPWEVREQDGVLTARGAPNGYLRTEKTYRHYTFEADVEPTAKLTDGKGPWAGDLIFGIPDPDPGFAKLTGVRVQVVPGGSGSVGRAGAAEAVAWPAFRPGWNRLTVNSGPDGVTGYLNGERVFTHRGADAGAGYVGIVSAGTGLRFRNIRIRPEAAAPPPPPGALVLPAPEPPGGVYAALLRARRERVAAAEKGLAAEKARFDAGRVTRREVAEAEAALIEAKLDGAPGAAAVRLLGQLVQKHETRREVAAERIKGGLLADDALNPIDADLARAKARLAEARLAAPPPAAAPFTADQAKTHQEAWAKHLGVLHEVSNDLGMRFRVVPAGSFQMGSTAEEVALVLKASPDLRDAEAWVQDRVRSEAPARKVTVTEPFLIGTHEVTVGQFREFVKATGHKTHAEKTGGGAVWDNAAKTWGQDPGAVWHNPKYAGSESHPVTFLNPADARAFCAWLGTQDGRTYALPTEEQWEFACRAGTATRWWFGDDPAGTKGAGWTVETAFGKHRPVGQLAANPFGLFDVHGNATEMATSPQGEVVERGGQANETAWRARSAWRNPVAEDARPHGRRGFRVAVVGDPRGEPAAAGPAGKD